MRNIFAHLNGRFCSVLLSGKIGAIESPFWVNNMTNSSTKYFIYTRKSTDTEDRQVRSLADQLSELRELAKREQLDVVDVFIEKQTAKSPGRPIFAEMIARI